MARRALLVLSLAMLIPWLCMRAVRELWISEGMADYLRSVLWLPLAPWFERGWWWHTIPQWYDWPVLPALIGLLIVATWPFIFGPLLAWIRTGRPR